jgi:two-component system phosphate regulon sensor histidine kinase PhoR
MVNLPGQPRAQPDEGGVWQLEVKHQTGSLEAAAISLRRSNQMLSFIMMALVMVDLAVLALLARRAHRLGEAKLEFAAAVSHELRTPLAAICSAADNLAAGVAHEPAKVQQYGVAILKQGQQLTDLVEQILAFATGQFGKTLNEFEPFELGPVVTRAIAGVSLATRAARVEIEERIPSDLPHVLGDAGAIEQALVNLLTNAIKYGGARDRIVVSVSNRTAELELSVEDKGPGIPASEQKRIFEPFYRGSTAMKSQSPGESHGAGLGLTIVEQIVRAHFGRVTVVSIPGRGSCFTLHLPVI